MNGPIRSWRSSKWFVPPALVLPLAVLFLAAGPAQADARTAGGPEGPPVDAAELSSPEDPVPAEVRVEPAELTLEPGESAELAITVLDRDGQQVDVPVRFVASLGALSLDRDPLTVTARVPGEHRVVAFVDPDVVDRDEPQGLVPPRAEIPVTVSWPPVDRLEIEVGERTLYEGTRLEHEARALYEDDRHRPDPPIRWSSSDPAVATVDRFGTVTAVSAGEMTVTAELDGITAEKSYRVEPFPGAELEIRGGAEEARTGDVLRFEARVLDEDGREVADVPVEWGYSFRPSDSRFDARKQPGAAGLMEEGRFVAEEPGRYGIVASAGGLSARVPVEIRQREVVLRIGDVGQGRVNNVHTSDFWPWVGHDGRHYAITGTWGGDGWAYIWDITDPDEIVKTDSIQVDARTVNDVKVSPDGRYATMTREGASDRRNGLVILDLADPAHPVIAAEHDEGLTGGVHNAFPTDDHVFALSAGEKYLILDVTDIYEPEYVAEVQLEDCRIHDIWVDDGLAWAAQWGCGVVVHDVGHGGWGGSPENPVFISQFTTPGGNTHAVFPYYHEDTDRLLVFAGDEVMSRPGRPLEGGLSIEPYDPEADTGGTPSNTDGYTHVLDYSDMENPRKIARYRVPEFGTHNIWVEDDILHQAYYEGGARLVDVSGDLMGNLHHQGREIAVFRPEDPAGFIANAPMVWSVMPFQGRVLLSDWNSGIWSLGLEPTHPRTLGEP